MLQLGDRLGVDALALLAERAAMAALRRRGTTSCGGSSRLLAVGDDWLAVTLARSTDVELVPAWIESDDVGGDVWASVREALRRTTAEQVVARGRGLGLPITRVGEVMAADRAGVVASRRGDASPLDSPPLVVDLSALWAGPLCARLLGHRGARVVKVESVTRLDGARAGPAEFFDLLHAGHCSVALDFADGDGVQRLRGLIAAADVVIDSSRPRALEQLGISVDELLAEESGPRVWVSITGYGREVHGGLATAFGDDAAAAGGLVAWGTDGAPRFAADAIADPLTGLAAGSAAVDALVAGGRWLVDAALARVAASVTGTDAGVGWAEVASETAVPPEAPAVVGRSRPFGADTDLVLQSLGIL